MNKILFSFTKTALKKKKKKIPLSCFHFFKFLVFFSKKNIINSIFIIRGDIGNFCSLEDIVAIESLGEEIVNFVVQRSEHVDFPHYFKSYA
jgi:hypothetical protein